MDPEIARRCSVCGATIRQRAAFCPQCGQAIDAQPDAEIAETQALDPKALDEKPKSMSDFESAPTVALNRADIESAPTVALNRSDADRARKQASDRAKGPVRHGRTDNVRDRVDKLRKVSHVVLDQAAYDPSVRFLLVAAAFLVLVVVLVIANRVLG